MVEDACLGKQTDILIAVDTGSPTGWGVRPDSGQRRKRTVGSDEVGRAGSEAAEECCVEVEFVEDKGCETEGSTVQVAETNGAGLKTRRYDNG